MQSLKSDFGFGLFFIVQREGSEGISVETREEASTSRACGPPRSTAGPGGPRALPEHGPPVALKSVCSSPECF